MNTSKLTVAVTRLDEPDPQLREFRDVVHQFDARIPVVAADPRDKDSVSDVIATALRLPTMTKEVVG